MHKHLILGGARSGKSRHAEHLALATGLPVSVIVTAEPLDAEMAARIAQHQADRPPGWTSIEAPRQLAQALGNAAASDRCVVVDCLTLWLSNLLCSPLPLDESGIAELPADCIAEQNALLDMLPGLPGQIILVANEVGLGLVPESQLGRLFRDEAGRLNQRLAATCEQVSLVVAGLPLRLK